MKLSGWVLHLATRALAESMDVHTMTHLARRLIHNYDIYRRTSFPRNIAIPNKDAAKQIVFDMKKQELFLEFVRELMEIRTSGIMGRKFRVPYLREILNELHSLGYTFDDESDMFIEDSRVRKTKNWGVLRENHEYIFTFLRFDIVESSRLVSRYSGDYINRIWKIIKEIVTKTSEKRDGRIWTWEGDGGLVAYYFANKENRAALTAIEILQELFIYNHMENNLNSEIEARIAIHTGPSIFIHRIENLRSDTINKTIELESHHTLPNSITVSGTTYKMLHQGISDLLEPVKRGNQNGIYRYIPCWRIS